MTSSPIRLIPLPADEAERLRALAGYRIVGTEAEPGCDEVVRLAADLFDAPMALVTLVDADRVWLKAREGLSACEVPRSVAFCSHAILQDEALIVPDLRADMRFASNPLVVGEPHARFYAGIPLVAPGGKKLGTLCIIDTQPRVGLSDKERRLLARLAGLVMERLEASRLAMLAAEEAQRAHAKLQTAIDELPEGIAFFDASRRYSMWNRRYAEIYPLCADLLAPGLPFETFLRAGLARGQFPESVGQEEAWLARRLELNDQERCSHERRLPGDRWLRIEERRMPDGGRIGIRVDITDLKRREASFRLLFDANPVPMWLYDAENLRFLAVNDAAVAKYGYGRERFLSMNVLDIQPVEERGPALEVLQTPLPSYESDLIWRHLRADGTEIQAVTFARALAYEGRAAMLVAAVDVTERMRAEARVAHMTHHDALTNLPNRVLLRERLEEALEFARRPGEREGFAVLLLDLDRFKHINDTLGHSTGDALLGVVAERLRACVRDTDTVARLGGDEFALVLPGVCRPERVGLFAARLIEILSAPFVVGEHRLMIGASIGVAFAPADGDDPDTLLRSADLALYRAKADGRGAFRFFETVMDLRLQLRRALELDLRGALRAGAFEVHYQPLVDAANGSVTGFEALIRWLHPERGMIAPADFIPLAEETGLIAPIGEWVLRQACAEAATWPGDVKVAVNLSPVQFKGGGLVSVVASALAASGLTPSRLELEITESVLLQDNEATLKTLHGLRNLGVRISMDDFGTGFSSLSYLRSFPFDKIKIDRSFVRDLPHDGDCLAIVRAVVGLGAGLSMVTTAEGVETLEQFEMLRSEGCTEVQGYFLGRPGPGAGVTALLAGGAAGVRAVA